MTLSLIVFGALAVVAGILAASTFVIERIESAKDLVDKMMPYQAAIGIAALLFGVFKLFDLARLREAFFTKGIFVGCVVACIVVGFLLGFPMIQKFLADDENTKEKIEKVRKKIAPYQVLSGLVAIGTGAYLILVGLF